MSETKQPVQLVPNTHDGLKVLLDRAQKGDKTVLPALQEILKDPLSVDGLGGDLAKTARSTLIGMFSSKNLLLRESVTRKLELMRGELAGPNPTALERLLVDRVITGWLHVHHLEQIYAQKNGMSFEEGTYYQRSMTSAQKRYLASIKALAMVRKLGVPVVQVNIARKQVNVATGCVVGGEAT